MLNFSVSFHIFCSVGIFISILNSILFKIKYLAFRKTTDSCLLTLFEATALNSLTNSNYFLGDYIDFLCWQSYQLLKKW